MNNTANLNPAFIEEMKKALLEKQQALQEELSGIASHTEEGDDLDASAQEVAEDEVNQDVIATIKSDLDKIAKALEKIQAGTYGVDEEGKAISEERLRALPWADKSI